MQPLIKFRLLASQLEQNELQSLLQTIIRLFGTEKLLSFIFNHFLTKYNQNKRHSEDLASIINTISSIIDSRNRNKSEKEDGVNTDHSSHKIKPQLSIDLLPSDLIGECASYLKMKDYLHFSKCNRKIYIGCNSPSRLQELIFDKVISEDLALNHCDLRQFASIKSLQISAKLFNKYIALYPQHKLFPKLTHLCVDDVSQETTEAMIAITNLMNTQCFKLRQIEYLHCRYFRSNFKFFCSFLSAFPNVTHLALSIIALTQFSGANQIIMISKLFPKLTSISVEATNALLRNELLRIHSKQIEALHYRETTTNVMNVVSFPKLKELCVTMGSVHTATKIISNTQCLERFKFTASQGDLNEQHMRKLIHTLFTKHHNLKHAVFSGNVMNIQKIMQYIELVLFDTMNVFRKAMTLVFYTTYLSYEAVDEFNLYVCRMINALDSSMIHDFMLGVHAVKADAKVFDIRIENFKQKHVVYAHNQSRSVIISNRNCKINGYRTSWKSLLNNIVLH